MNIELLREVQHLIALDADGFDMSDREKPSGRAVCGTTHCIGGYAIYLYEGTPTIEGDKVQVAERARKALNLSEEQADRLFFVSQWPTNFRSRYTSAASRKQAAEVAIEYIDYFIQTEQVKP